MAHSPARSAIAVGTVIADTYTVERLIGRGGMGAVFAASHARLPGKHVAIKVLHPDIADAESLTRFRREAEIASRLGHPNIVEVHDFNLLPDGTPYLVLELLHGESLADRLERGPLSLEATLTIVRQVASALAAAHREDIVHRDLKPQNVFMVTMEAEGFASERAKVLDFGISKIRGSQTVKTQDSAILGTPQYMAPEQALGNHAAVDQRTDVFALGAMVYEMLCGQPAFTGMSIPEVVFKVVYEEPPPLAGLVPGLPPHIPAAIHRALTKKADDRFPDVSAFVEAMTGTPLTISRRHGAVLPGAASGARAAGKVATGDALAQTMGSGDHGGAIGVAATVGSGDHAAQAYGSPAAPAAIAAGTVPGHLAAGTLTPAATPTPTATPGVTPTTTGAPAPTSNSRTPLVLGVVLVLAAAAVAITFLVTRGGGADTRSPDREPIATRPPAESPAGSVAPVAPPIPPGEVPVATVTVDAGAAVATPPVAPAAGPDAGPKAGSKGSTRPRPPEPSTPPTPPGDDDDGATGEIKALLAAAEAALSDEDAEAALKAAARVLRDAGNNAHAFSLRARAFCLQQDKERAMAAMRKINRPAARARAVRFCKANGVDL